MGRSLSRDVQAQGRRPGGHGNRAPEPTWKNLAAVPLAAQEGRSSPMRVATGGRGPGTSPLPPSISIHLELPSGLPTCAALGGRERDRRGGKS